MNEKRHYVSESRNVVSWASDDTDLGELDCNHCGKPLPCESVGEYEKKLAQHILDDHHSVASSQTLREARGVLNE